MFALFLLPQFHYIKLDPVYGSKFFQSTTGNRGRPIEQSGLHYHISFEEGEFDITATINKPAWGSPAIDFKLQTEAVY